TMIVILSLHDALPILVQIDVEYLGDLHCKVIHTPSGQSFITDAPIDNQGKGEFISPTDLTAASIASCIATIMAIKARNSGFDIEDRKSTRLNSSHVKI